jgi:transcriptional regulator with XRE-family HTH domain
MTSHPVDIFAGSKLRTRRIMLGLSQDNIGKSVGVTFQQIQKYERGVNRMGSSRLYDFGKVLSVPISYFFEGYEQTEDVSSSYHVAGMAEENNPFEHDVMSNKETLDLVRSYYSIKDEKVRRRFYELLRSMADTENSH